MTNNLGFYRLRLEVFHDVQKFVVYFWIISKLLFYLRATVTMLRFQTLTTEI